MRRLAVLLLATTSLTLATAAPSLAIPVTESTDFGNTAGTATLLGAGTLSVLGSVDGAGDPADFFKWMGLAAGSSYDLVFAPHFIPGAGCCATFDASVLDSSPSTIAGPGTFGGISSASLTLSGIVPIDGTLIADIDINAVGPFGFLGTPEGYQVNLSLRAATGVPEPASLALFGVGLAGLGLVRRRRRTKRHSA